MSSNVSEISGHGRELILVEETGAAEYLVERPGRKRDRFLLATFILVVLGAALYNFILATPRYASQFSYIVRSLDSSHERISVLNIAAVGAGSDDAEAIVVYIRSRDMLANLNRDGFVTHIFAASGVDSFSAFPSLFTGHSQEGFFRHFQNYVSADFDHQSNITTVEVQAFSAADARVLAERMLQASERMVNGLNARARAGMIEAGEEEVEEASATLARKLARLNAVRDQGRILEPELAAGAAIEVSSTSATELARINIQLANVLRVAPDSPLVPQLRVRRNAIEAELARQTGATAGNPGSLAARIRPYEELAAERDIAEKRLLTASLALSSARNNANRNRLYIERISQPSQPDTSRYPRGLRNLLLVMLVAAAVLWIIRSLSELVMDDHG